MKKQYNVHIIRPQKSGFSYALLENLDRIFFEAATAQTFADSDARAAFRRRWLGDYLTENPEEVLVAVNSGSQPVGYLVGDLCDPATNPRYAELAYFQTFAPWTKPYPAHLHINVAAQHRSAGIGALLIQAFARHARRQGAPGMHVVTGKGLRNVGFYERNGFHQVAEAPWHGGHVVMLAQQLRP